MQLMLTNPSANAMATKTFGDGVIPHIVSYPRGVENFYVVSEKKFFFETCTNVFLTQNILY